MHGSNQIQNIKKRCAFFIVPGNGQALLRMPDTAALKLININIDSIQVETVESKTNIEQELRTVEKSYANADRLKNQTRCQQSKWPKQHKKNI